MKIIKILFITISVLVFAIIPAKAATTTMYNPPKSGFSIKYAPGSGVYPNVKQVRVQGYSSPIGNRVQDNQSPCSANANTRIAGRIRPVYPYYRPIVRSLGAVHVDSLNKTANNDYYYGRYNNGYGNRIYINNNGNGNIYIRQ